MISKGSVWEGHRAKSDIISITERGEEEPTFPSSACSTSKNAGAVLSFFSGCGYSKSLRPKLWKKTHSASWEISMTIIPSVSLCCWPWFEVTSILVAVVWPSPSPSSYLNLFY